jgi:hypothetical protein
MSDQTTKDNNRRNLPIINHPVDYVLPSHFTEQYPLLIKMLEYYYQFEHSGQSPSRLIHDLFATRDITQTDLSLLTFIEDELLLGQSYFEGFDDKRAAAKYSNTLYRSKGSKYSLEQFFRTFFGVDPDIVYTKENVFIVGESEIGPESQRYITDDKLYQTFALLIKTSIPIATWIEMYKLFVHPAGMYIGGEVQLVVDVKVMNDEQPDVVLDDKAQDLVVQGDAFTDIAGFTDFSGLVATDSSGNYRVAIGTPVTLIQDVETGDVDQMYNQLSTQTDINSPKLSDDSDGTGRFIGMSSTMETMDQDLYGLYDSAG